MPAAAMGPSEYARHWNAAHPDARPVTAQTIAAARRRGVLPTFASGPNKGKINVTRADAEWAPSTTVGAKRGVPYAAPRKIGTRIVAPSVDPAAATAIEPTVTTLPSVGDSRQVLEQIKAQREAAAWRREQGLVIERDEVVKLLTDFGHRVRRELQSHPRKMQAALVRQIRCRKCGGDIEGKVIAIEAERYVADLLRVLADDPLAGA